MSKIDPAAPALGSGVPNTTRGTRASTIAPAHIAQGSRVTYMTESRTRHDSTARAASRRAMISACAVGSCRNSRSLRPTPMTSPSRTTTAPIGTSSCSSARSASRRASRMKYSSRKKNLSVIPTPSMMPRRPALALAAASLALLAPVPARASTDTVKAGEVVVGYHSGRHEVIRTVRPAAAIARLRARPDVSYAVRNHVARASQATFEFQLPNDPGRGTTPGGWQEVQWNFLGNFGVDAPTGWKHVFDAGHPGGRGVTIAVLDTGVAYKDAGRFRRSPDLVGTRF